MEHAFNTNVAAKYDLNIATLLQNFRFWTRDNLANKRNINEGLCWTYNTVQAFCEIFHYWTRHQIEHLLKKAEAQGLIVSGNYNCNKYDRTKWYALTPEAYQFFDDLQSEVNIERLYASILKSGEIHKSLISCISEKSEMDFGKFRNLFRKSPKPIPDTIPDTNPYINNISTSDNSVDLGYNQEGNEKSDYQVNQSEEKENDSQVVDTEKNSTKSDYFDNQTYKCTIKSKSYQLSVNDILQDNPYQIPEQIIQDWIANRKQKRVAVTKTAWNKINKELAKCDDPISAFEEMVLAGWQSFKAEWVNKKTSSSNKSFFDHDSTKWAEGIEQDMF
jgi:hypothetical protein